MSLPTDAKERKHLPIGTGVLDYFPKALAEISKVSLQGNKQHNLGPLHWDKSKSTDEADALIRHYLERGKFDNDGCRHSAKMAWRALAFLERELDAEELKAQYADESFVRIHPSDLAAMINDPSHNGIVDILKHADGTFTIFGIKYQIDPNREPETEAGKANWEEVKRLMEIQNASKK